MLTNFRKSLSKVIGALAWPFVKLGVPPNWMTVSSLALTLLAGGLVVVGRFWWAAVPYALGSLLDALDGTVARAEDKVTSFGAFLDSSLDRYSDGVIIGAFLVAFASLVGRLVALAALLGSFLVSYSRARGEALGLKMEGVGLGERAERIIITFLALLVPAYRLWILLVLALLANFTFLQRAWAVRARVSGRGRSITRGEAEGRRRDATRRGAERLYFG